MLRRIGWVLAVACSVAACSGDDGGGSEEESKDTSDQGDKSGDDKNGGGDDKGGDDKGGDDNGGNGVTACGEFPDFQPKSCQAGQYCDDETISRCVNGCLSDTNCASNQTCVKQGDENIGSCQNKPEETECEAVCDKMQACDPQVTTEMCNQFCAGTNATCHACVANGNCTELPDACADACGAF